MVVTANGHPQCHPRTLPLAREVITVLADQIEGCCSPLFDRERVFIIDNLMKRANGNLSHKTLRSKTGSLESMEVGGESGGSYN